MNDEQMKEQPNITDADFEWTSPVHTDVQATWRRFGWRPKHEIDAEIRQREAA